MNVSSINNCSYSSAKPCHWDGLLPSFFIGGFECSTPLNTLGVRVDELETTCHVHHVRADYGLLRTVGIRVARDGVRWNLVDTHAPGF